MIRNYTRKTDRQQWEENAMESAILGCHNNIIIYRKAAIIFNVPQTFFGKKSQKV